MPRRRPLRADLDRRVETARAGLPPADERQFAAPTVPDKDTIPGFEALPAAPGVYLFHGDETHGTLPLYIGKSVNLRDRVQAHFRDASELRMMSQLRRIEHLRTAGEIGALLLESRLIKERQPLYNIRLRRSRQLCAWQLTPDPGQGRPVLVDSRQLEFATAPDLYGLYSSAWQARQALQAVAEANRLCLAVLGLEAPSRRGCFGLQIGRCDGACVGRESMAEHAARLRDVMQADAVQRWPFAGPVGLVERDGDWRQTHVVHQWRHLGTMDSRDPRPTTLAPGGGFDLDAYRILIRPLVLEAQEVVVLQELQGWNGA